MSHSIILMDSVTLPYVKKPCSLNVLIKNEESEPEEPMPGLEAVSLWTIKRTVYTPEIDINAPISVPIFQAFKSSLKISGQQFIVPARTPINLVSINIDRQIEADGIVKLLNSIIVYLPDGCPMVLRGNTNTTYFSGYENATQALCFVLPIKTRIQSGPVKSLTSVEHTFTFLPSTSIICKPGTMMRLHSVRIKLEDNTDFVLP